MDLKSWNDKHIHSQDAAVWEKHPSVMGSIGKTNPVPFLGRLQRRAHKICMNSVPEMAPSSPCARVFSGMLCSVHPARVQGGQRSQPALMDWTWQLRGLRASLGASLESR